MMFVRSASFEHVLSCCDYLVENRFTVTDIIVSWTVNWGGRQGLLDGMNGLHAYLERLF
ncbi:MAG: hypothetical protein CM1200mP18_15110 [Gammaproteobacteria bacterium]|nr:MAG: hypothetical protein CM1200mP18_15110 [Gammaproteobacteria bacterium]